MVLKGTLSIRNAQYELAPYPETTKSRQGSSGPMVIAEKTSHILVPCMLMKAAKSLRTRTPRNILPTQPKVESHRSSRVGFLPKNLRYLRLPRWPKLLQCNVRLCDTQSKQKGPRKMGCSFCFPLTMSSSREKRVPLFFCSLL